MPTLLKHKWLLVALALASLAGRMLLTSKHFYTHDDIQVIRVHEFVECFRQGQIPCRWASELGKGYGYPWFNYYPPMIYVLPSLLHLAGLSIITSLNLFMFATFLLAAWAMYCLVKELTKKDDIACFGSVLYTLYPFHATNVFVRGVAAENLAWSFAPLLLLTLYLLVMRGKWQKWLPLCFAFVFLTHIISSFVLIGIALCWVVALSWTYRKNVWRILRHLIIAILVGLGISAFFFVPALAQKGLVQSESLTQGYYAFTNHYVSLFQLFSEYKWNYSASLWGEAWDEMPYMVGHIHTALITLLILLLAWLRPRGHRSYHLIVAVLALALVLLFLTHFKSNFIWIHLSPMAYLQFPWRLIAWAGLPLTLTISLMLALLPKKLTNILIFLVTCILLIYSYPFFFPRGYDIYRDEDYLSGSQYVDQQTKSLFDYLPKTVKAIPPLPAQESDFPIPIFYFPGWVADVPIQADPVYGLITPVNPGDQVTNLHWHETPLRLAMDLTSLLSLIFYIMYNKRYGQT